MLTSLSTGTRSLFKPEACTGPSSVLEARIVIVVPTNHSC